jgi:hypothetical protein
MGAQTQGGNCFRYDNPHERTILPAKHIWAFKSRTTVEYATEYSTGLAKVRDKCTRCYKERETMVTTPRLPRESESSSESSGGGGWSSGGSSSGGDYSGGSSSVRESCSSPPAFSSCVFASSLCESFYAGCDRCMHAGWWCGLQLVIETNTLCCTQIRSTIAKGSNLFECVDGMLRYYLVMRFISSIAVYYHGLYK